MKSWKTKGEENRASTTRVLHTREFSNSRDSYPRARVRARIKFSSPQVVFATATFNKRNEMTHKSAVTVGSREIPEMREKSAN